MHSFFSSSFFSFTLTRIAIAGILTMGVVGCGHHHHHVGYGHHHHHGGGGAALVAIGVIAGAGIVAASRPDPEPREQHVYVNNYYSGIPVAPVPRSTRDTVDQNENDLPPFDPHAARAALNAIDVSGCREAGAPKGFGHARVTFNPDGRASKVVVDAPAGLSADAARCIGDRIGTASVPPFKGNLVTMGTTYRVL